ncbi:MAG: ABC-2 family transporter protein [Abditibacteriales bacterium]|nr:ABC-2 family transporter protein [Abditibacteriales bacterium]MDW8368381.1 ABC-2 family transporter protein [Abditibacteriales bacterium]
MRLRKYATILNICWQDVLQYRGNAMGWTLFDVLPSLTMILVWMAAYRTRDHIGGLNLQEMVTYYLAMTLLAVCITPHGEWDISMSIRQGLISQHLVRPIDYFLLQSLQQTAWQIMKGGLFLPGFALIAFLFRDFAQFPSLTVGGWLAFALSCGLTYLLFLELKFLLGISAFWVGSAGGFIEVWYMLMLVFSGQFVPLTVMPDVIQRLGEFLPFRYLYYFPLMILLGKAAGDAVLRGLLTQAVWVGTMFIAVRLTWRAGVRAYEGFGG